MMSSTWSRTTSSTTSSECRLQAALGRALTSNRLWAFRKARCSRASCATTSLATSKSASWATFSTAASRGGPTSRPAAAAAAEREDCRREQLGSRVAATVLVVVMVVKTKALPPHSAPPRKGSALGRVSENEDENENEDEKVKDRRSSPAFRPLVPAWATPLHRTPIERHAGACLGFRMAAAAAAVTATVGHTKRHDSSHAGTPLTKTEEDMARTGPWAARMGASAADSVVMLTMSSEEGAPRKGKRLGGSARFPILRATTRCCARWTISSWWVMIGSLRARLRPSPS
ncbi:unnamed protein product [Ectocarpus sp. 4 AP-2014]